MTGTIEIRADMYEYMNVVSPCSNWKKIRSALSNSSSGKLRMKRVCTSSRASSAAPDGASSSISAPSATAVPIEMAKISSAVGMWLFPPDVLVAWAYENSGEAGCVFTPAASAAAWAWAFPPRPRLFFREDDAGMMWCNGRGFGNECSREAKVWCFDVGALVLACACGACYVRAPQVHIAYSKNQ